MNIDIHFTLPWWALPFLLHAFIAVFYTLYIAAINIYRDWDTLALWVKINSIEIVFTMMVLDVLTQLTLATVLFFDWPQEGTVTQRLSRYKSDAWPAGRRKDIAITVCRDALNPFDVKGHC